MSEENRLLTVSASPHRRTRDTTRGIMLDVIIALLPALIISFMLFGTDALIRVAVSVAACVLFEFICRKVMKRDNTVGDLSAIVTGILLAFNLPSEMPLWMVAIGDAVAIIVVKQFFGGIGQNFVNPALVGRIVLIRRGEKARMTNRYKILENDVYKMISLEYEMDKMRRKKELEKQRVYARTRQSVAAKRNVS